MCEDEGSEEAGQSGNNTEKSRELVRRGVTALQQIVEGRPYELRKLL